MVGPRPILTNGLVRVEYTDSSLGPHVMNLDVEVDDFTLAVPNFICKDGIHRQWTTCLANYTAVLRPLYNASTSITQAILLEYSGGAYIPRKTQSLGLAGTASGANVPACQATVTFRDTAYIPDRFVLLEGALSIPFHQGYAGLPGQLKAFVDEVLDDSTDHTGNWYKSKSNNFIASFQFWTDAFNKHLRRKRGLV